MTLAKYLAEGEGTAVSTRTVKRRLQIEDLNGWIAAWKLLVRKHAARRLMWAREYKEIPQWSKMLWLDESIF